MTAQTETPYNSLMEQLRVKQEAKNAVQKPEANEVPIQEASANSEEMGSGSEGEGDSDVAAESKSKILKFTKGEKSFDVDDDAEFEFFADKKSVKMTLSEMRDAAAGGVAVRNRMRQLAEEKKALQDPYKDFSKTYKDDPFNALKKVFSAIKKVDPEVDFNEFIADLGKQAQNMAELEPSDRKAYLAEKELEDVKGQLTETQRLQKISDLKEQLIQETGLPEEKIFSFGQEILKDPVLSQTVKNEEDLMERIGDLAEEVEMQKASHEALLKYKPTISPRDPLVFELSNLLKANPDFDEQDLSEIARDVMSNVQRAQASQRLSKKNRSWTGSKSSGGEPDLSKMKPVDALKYQIEAKRKQQNEAKR